jgi:chemotaxis protein MotA
MLFGIGMVVLIGSILGGFMPHGDIAVLWQPLEILIIGGSAAGGFIIANPKNVIMGSIKGFMQVLKGSPYNKVGYLELLTMLYAVLRMAKTQGSLALETHIDAPHESELFSRYPKFAGDHHALTFLCDYLRMMTMGTENAYQMEDLIDAEIETLHAEHSQYSNAINGIGDGLPAFGIVAAVLGVINTMGSILEPPEVLGGMIGGALVGTFLGVLAAYGVVLPIASSLKAVAEAEIKYYLCIKAALVAHMQGHAPMIAVEFARKSLYSEFRPSFAEVEDAMNDVPAAA